MNVNSKLNIVNIIIDIINIIIEVLKKYGVIILIKDKYMAISTKLLYKLHIKILWEGT